MYNVVMVVDGNEYCYGSYADRNKANEVALYVCATREIETFVEFTKST